MNKIWLMGSVAAVATVAVMVWGAQPARSSQTQDWLSRAQTEFASKARDAVIERKLGPARSQSQDAGQNPVVVAVATPADPPVVESPMELPVAVMNTPVVSSPVETARPVELPAREEAVSAVAAEPEAHEVATSAPIAPVEIAPAQEQAVPSQAEPVVNSTARPSATEIRPREAAPKPRHAARQAAPARAGRRSFDNSAEAQGLRALRQHAPGIAAMVSRYM